jgi:hypothetical protein
MSVVADHFSQEANATSKKGPSDSITADIGSIEKSGFFGIMAAKNKVAPEHTPPMARGSSPRKSKALPEI